MTTLYKILNDYKNNLISLALAPSTWLIDKISEVYDALWSITNSGGSLSRTAFPYTIKNWNKNSHPEYPDITVTTNFDVTNIGLENTLSFDIDGTTKTQGLYARDCTAIISCSGTSAGSLSMMIPAIDANTSGTFSGYDFMKLDKTGKVIEMVDHALPYVPTIPANAFTYNSNDDEIIIGTGTYDASTRYNTPCEIETAVTLTNQGGMYADNDFTYYYSLNEPSSNFAFFQYSKLNDAVTQMKIWRSSGTSAIYISSYNASGILIPEGEANARVFDENNQFQYVWTLSNSSSQSSYDNGYYLNSGQTITIDLTIDPTKFITNFNNQYDYTFSYYDLARNGHYGDIQITWYYNDDTSEVFPTADSSNPYRTNTVTLEKLAKLVKVRILTTGSGSSKISYKATPWSSEQSGNPQILGEYVGAYSRPIRIETMQDWSDPTKGRLDIGMGFNSGYYANANTTTGLESITTTPLYEVFE